MDKPKTEKSVETGGGNQLRYGIGSMQGWRAEMEDTHVARIGLGHADFANWSFFAVFDGHAGKQVADYASQNILHTLMGCSEFHEAACSARTVTEKNDLMHLVFAKSFLTVSPQNSVSSFSRVHQFMTRGAYFRKTSGAWFDRVLEKLFYGLVILCEAALHVPGGRGRRGFGSFEEKCCNVSSKPLRLTLVTVEDLNRDSQLQHS